MRTQDIFLWAGLAILAYMVYTHYQASQPQIVATTTPNGTPAFTVLNPVKSWA
jgi:uncharacterized membrane protein YebE (DUF533 family)